MFKKRLTKIGVINPKCHTLKHLLSKHPVSQRRMIFVYRGIEKWGYFSNE